MWVVKFFAIYINRTDLADSINAIKLTDTLS